MACGNCSVTRAMIVSIGGLAVRSALQDAASRPAALAAVLGRTAMARKRGDYFVTGDGVRRSVTVGDEQYGRHVHVVPNVDQDGVVHRGVTLLQVKDVDRVGDVSDKSGKHYEFVLLLRPTSDARIRQVELDLVAEMNARAGRKNR